MNTKEKLVPELRFPEFTDEWEEKKLGEIAELITKGTTPKKYISDGEVNFLRIENIRENFICTKHIKKIGLEEHNSRLKRSILKENDILFSIAGALGKTLIIRKKILPANTNQALALIRLENSTLYLVEYIYRQLNSFRIQSYIKSISTVGAQPNLSLKQVSEFIIFLPSPLEQQKIGNFFNKIDKKLELQRKRIEELKTYKKGIMQRIFNQEIRFKDKNGNEYPEWEKKNLGDLIEKGKAGGTPLSTNSSYYNGDIPFLSISDMTSQGKYLYKTEKTITEEGLNNSSSWLVPKNSLIYSMYASIGFVSINKIPLATSQAMYSMIVDTTTKTEYLYYYLTYVRKQEITRLTETGTQGNFNAGIVRSLLINLPSKVEQTKIANFLSAIDKKIELEEEKLKEYEKYKKGLMQRMFI